MAVDPFSGPIPGENYTSDTKNYPWHRPPEVTDLDDAIELAARRLMNEDVAEKILTMVEMKLPIVRIADIFVTGGIMQGKWSPDVAIMIAGPVTHIIKIMADGYGIKNYNMGLDKKTVTRGKNFYKTVSEIDEQRAAVATAGVPEEISGIIQRAEDMPDQSGGNIAPPNPRTGFMGMSGIGGPGSSKGMIEAEGNEPNEQAPEAPEEGVV